MIKGIRYFDRRVWTVRGQGPALVRHASERASRNLHALTGGRLKCGDGAKTKKARIVEGMEHLITETTPNLLLLFL